MFKEDNRAVDGRPDSNFPLSSGLNSSSSAAYPTSHPPDAQEGPQEASDQKCGGCVVQGRESVPNDALGHLQTPQPDGADSVAAAAAAKTESASLLSSYMETKAATGPFEALFQTLPDVEKWSQRKARSLLVVDPLRQVDSDRALKLERCGGVMAFQRWIEHGMTTVENPDWCNQARLCQCCAHARGIKLAKQAAEKIAVVLARSPELRPYLVTFTVKNGPDLGERLEHLLASFTAGWKRRKNFTQGRRSWTSFCAPTASIFSAEIKRGANSDLWHPHLHCVWLVPSEVWKWHDGKTGLQLEPNAHRQLCDEWYEITGDSFVINAKPLRTAVDQSNGEEVRSEHLTAELFEVFKYLTKPGATSPADVVHAWQVTSGKRLVRTHGDIRGLVMPDDLDGEKLGGQSWKIWYRWQAGGYQLDREPIFLPSENDHGERTKAA